VGTQASGPFLMFDLGPLARHVYIRQCVGGAGEAVPQEVSGATSETVSEEGGDRGHAPQEGERPAQRPWWRRRFGG
jgi:hypothetical protein